MNNDFQTPTFVSSYMISLLKEQRHDLPILDPTPGRGNLLNAAQYFLYDVIDLRGRNFYQEVEWLRNREMTVVMNPPFSPMKKGYEILKICMDLSDRIIALMPWLAIINSEKRTKQIMDYGLKGITHLPRKVFPGSRVQTCILDMEKNYRDECYFRAYTYEHVFGYTQ